MIGDGPLSKRLVDERFREVLRADRAADWYKALSGVRNPLARTLYPTKANEVAIGARLAISRGTSAPILLTICVSSMAIGE
jgi:hypothetical protein